MAVAREVMAAPAKGVTEVAKEVAKEAMEVHLVKQPAVTEVSSNSQDMVLNNQADTEQATELQPEVPEVTELELEPQPAVTELETRAATLVVQATRFSTCQ